MALLRNPKREIPKDLLRGWAEHVKRDPDFGNVSQSREEGILVADDGLLRIDWPRFVDSGVPVDVDLILVTANDPQLTVTSPSYPTPEAIANAWNAAGGTHADYFWKNVDNGISTFQDDEIRTLLRPRAHR